MIDRNFLLNIYQTSSDINEYILSLYNVPVQKNAQHIVEIGAGVSTFALVAAAQYTGGHVWSIDITGRGALNRYPDGEKILLSEPHFTFIHGSSIEISFNTHVDFLFLDSEHTLELTRKEIAVWFPRVVAGGVIALHDTMHESTEKQGARQALNEYLQEHADEYTRIDLLDSKIIGMTFLVKIWR